MPLKTASDRFQRSCGSAGRFHNSFSSICSVPSSSPTTYHRQGGRMRRHVDLNAHINETIARGNPADFPVSLTSVFHEGPDGLSVIPDRRAIVRDDTGEAIAVVSDRYT